MTNRVRITIEVLGEPGTFPRRTEFEFENMEAVQEQGFKRNLYFAFEPNGHHRFSLKAWSGCKTFDAFETVERDYKE